MFTDLTGKKFGRLTVIKRVENDKSGFSQWLCKCDCGNEKIVRATSLLKGEIVSCRCYQREAIAKSTIKHRMIHTPLYNIWLNMKNRCNNPNNKSYKHYGGRGIKVCDEWQNDYMSFYTWCMAHGYKKGLSLDRINNDGNYEPTNCRWVTQQVQLNNTRRCKMITMDGKTQSLSDWAREYNVPIERTRQRVVNRGWGLKEALTTPSFVRKH